MSWLSDRTGISVDLSPNQRGGAAIQLNGPSESARSNPIARAVGGTLDHLTKGDIAMQYSGIGKGIGGLVGLRNTRLSAAENTVLRGSSQATVAAVGIAYAAPYVASAYTSASAAVAAHPVLATVGASSLAGAVSGKNPSSDSILRNAAIGAGVDPGLVNALPLTDFSNLNGGHPDTGPALSVNNQSGVRPQLSNFGAENQTYQKSYTPPMSTTNTTLIYSGAALIFGLILMKKFKVI